MFFNSFSRAAQRVTLLRILKYRPQAEYEGNHWLDNPLYLTPRSVFQRQLSFTVAERMWQESGCL